MKYVSTKSLLMIGGSAILLFGWWVSDIPIGYYEFKHKCRDDGRLRTYQIIDKNVGWITSNEVYAREIVSTFLVVPFARFESDQHSEFDVRYKGGNTWWSSSYEVISADHRRNAGYKFELRTEAVQNAIRLRQEIQTLRDIRTNQIVFQTKRYIFTWTNPKNTLFGMSSTVDCPTYLDEIRSINSLLNNKE